jgi:ABC-type nitrate/sulfonate/bicarbonate transport system substrate-binding protein
MPTRTTGRKWKLFPCRARVILAVCTLVLFSTFIPAQTFSQERLKIIYSQFTMTNSATWFAREAGLFERHGLNADLIYVDSTPAVQALTAGAAPLATMSGGLAVGPYLIWSCSQAGAT